MATQIDQITSSTLLRPGYGRSLHYHDGNVYFVGADHASPYNMSVWKKTSGSSNFVRQDSSNEPSHNNAGGVVTTSVDSVIVGDVLYIVSQANDAGIIEPFRYYEYRLSDNASPDTWNTGATATGPALAQTGGTSYYAKIAVRSTGDVLIAYADSEKIHGTNYDRVVFVENTGSGFTTIVTEGTGNTSSYSSGGVVIGASNKAHHFFYDGSLGYLVHKSLADGSSSFSSAIANSTHTGGYQVSYGDVAYRDISGDEVIYQVSKHNLNVRWTSITNDTGSASTGLINDGSTYDSGSTSVVADTTHPTSDRWIAVFDRQSGAGGEAAMYDENSGSGWGTDTVLTAQSISTSARTSAITYNSASSHILGFVLYGWNGSNGTFYGEETLATLGESVSLNTLSLASSPQTTTVVPGATAVTFNSLTLAGSPENISPSLPVSLVPDSLTATTSLEESALPIDVNMFWDDFDDNSLDTSKWTPNNFGNATVTETNSRIEISYPSGAPGVDYSDLFTKPALKIGPFSRIVCEFLDIPVVAGNYETYMTVRPPDWNQTTNNTQISFFIAGTGTNFDYTIFEDGASTYTGSVAYNSTTHRWWSVRVEEDTVSTRVYIDFSTNGVDWIEAIGGAVTQFDLGKAWQVNIGAGAYGTHNADTMAFDNFGVISNDTFDANVPNKGQWTYEQTALSPGVGQWDDTLWGAAAPSSIVWFKGQYFMYYVGASGDTGEPDFNVIDRKLGVATSNDLRNWTKYSGNPIITFTTGGSSEEGVGSAVPIVVGGTMHLYYTAIRDVGGGNVDLEIRYQSSTDGFNFSGDTLIFQSVGNEYIARGGFHDGTNYWLYIAGPLTVGRGVLNTITGTSATSLGSLTAVSPSTVVGGGGQVNFIDATRYLMQFQSVDTAAVSGGDITAFFTFLESAPNTMDEEWVWKFKQTWELVQSVIGQTYFDPDHRVWYWYRQENGIIELYIADAGRAINLFGNDLTASVALDAGSIEAAINILLNTLQVLVSSETSQTVPGTVATLLNSLTVAGTVDASSISTVIAVLLNALGLTGNSETLSITPGEVSVLQNVLTAAFSADTSSVLPGEVTTLLNELLLNSSPELSSILATVSLLMNTVSMAGSAETLAVIPGVVTTLLNSVSLASSAETTSLLLVTAVLLNALTLDSSGEILTILPGAVSIVQNTLSIISSPESYAVLPGLVSVLTSTLTTASSTELLQVVAGAVSILTNALTVSASPEALSIIANAVVELLSVSLTGSSESVLALTGAVQALLNTLTLTSSAGNNAVLPGLVQVLQNTLTLGSAIESFTVDASVNVLLTVLSLAGSAETVTVDNLVAILMATLSATLSGQTTTTVPGGVSVLQNTVNLTSSTQNPNVFAGIVLALNTLGLSSSAQQISIQTAVNILLNTLVGISSAESLTVASVVSILMTELALAINPQVASVVPGVVSTIMATLGITGIAESATVQIVGALLVALNSLSLAGSPETLAVIPGAVQALLSEVSLVSSTASLSVLGIIGVLLDTLTLSSIGNSIIVVPGAIETLVQALLLNSSIDPFNLLAETFLSMETVDLSAVVDGFAVIPGATFVLLSEINLASQSLPAYISGGRIIRYNVTSADGLTFGGLLVTDESKTNLTVGDE